MHPYTYELIQRERHRALLTEAAAARLARLAKGKNTSSKRLWPHFIDDVLQKVSFKFIGVYHHLYQKNKAVIRLKSENSG